MSTTIVYNQLHALHTLQSKHHPQNPKRISSILQHLQTTLPNQSQYTLFTYQSLLSKLSLNQPKIYEQEKNEKINQNNQIQSNKMENVQNKNLTQKQRIQDLTLKQILKLHGKRYYEFIEGMWCQGLSKPEMFINVDTYYMKETFNAAMEAAKTAIAALQFIIQEEQDKNKDNHKNVFCLIRPPGHHSGLKNQPHGFSFFNNIALAADLYVKNTKKKAIILDWDIHHGQGTQKIFYQRNDVLYISLHRFDQGLFFPHIKQSGCQFVGQKQGEGYNINICWNFPKKQKDQIRKETQTVRDQEYIYCFQKIILPILNSFEYGIIFVSCGFDCAFGDPIGDSKITNNGFRIMSKMLSNLNKPVFLALQGGYNLQCLQKGVISTLQGLDKTKQVQTPEIEFNQLNSFAQKDIENCISHLKKYWKFN